MTNVWTAPEKFEWVAQCTNCLEVVPTSGMTQIEDDDYVTHTLCSLCYREVRTRGDARARKKERPLPSARPARL